MKKRFVFDEWLLADLDGSNGDVALTEAVQILSAVFKKCDQLVSCQDSPFLRKFYEMAKRARGDCRRRIVKEFKAKFLQNSEKLLLLRAEELPKVSHEIDEKVKEDDWYLVQCYVAGGADCIVTTDNPLIEALSKCFVRCQHREDFLSSYLQQQPDM